MLTVLSLPIRVVNLESLDLCSSLISFISFRSYIDFLLELYLSVLFGGIIVNDTVLLNFI
jgi:hypothetical protein